MATFRPLLGAGVFRKLLLGLALTIPFQASIGLADQSLYSSAPLASGAKLVFSDGRKFIVSKLLGEGGFSRVYSATDQKGNVRAIKINYETPPGINIHPKGNYLMPIEILKANIYKSAKTKKPTFTDKTVEVMPVGQSLLNMMVATKIDDFNSRVELARDVLHDITIAILEMHDENFVHNDVKPANIIYLEHHFVLNDFGIATSAGSGRFGSSGNFSSPELNNGDITTFYSDFYSLGLALTNILNPYDKVDAKLYDGSLSFEQIYKNLDQNRPLDAEHYADLIDIVNFIKQAVIPDRLTRTHELSKGYLKRFVSDSKTLYQPAYTKEHINVPMAPKSWNAPTVNACEALFLKR